MKKSVLMFCMFGLTVSCGRREPAATGPHSVITGKISGVGNRAPGLARVDVYEPDRSDAPRRIQADADGAFTVTTTQTGVVRLSFTGVQHNSYSVALLIQQPTQVKVDARLAPFEWATDFKEIMVVGDFNRWSRNSGYVLMVKQTDGTYAAELGNLEGPTTGYRLIGLVKGSTRSVPGTLYDDLDTDPAGNYVSRLAVRNGKVRIVFDAARLPHSTVEPGVFFGDTDSETARVAVLEQDMRKRQEAYSRALAEYTSFGKNPRDFAYDWSKTAAELKGRLETEKAPVIRQMLFLSLLDLKHLRAREIEPETARQALAIVPPDSPIWELSPWYLLYESIKLAGGVDANASYFQELVTRHPSREVRALALEQAYGDARATLNLERAREYYQRLTTEFSDLLPGQRVKSRPPELRIAAGKMMPEFSFTSLDDSYKTLTNETFKGKSYLVEFWATWCVPCVAEMENLHRIYGRYGKRDFEILSLSFDAVPEDVQKFRAKRWRMPWQHGFIGKDEFRVGSNSTDYFEVPEIPKAILVDKTGRIVAAGTDLIGDALERQIVRLIGN